MNLLPLGAVVFCMSLLAGCQTPTSSPPSSPANTRQPLDAQASMAPDFVASTNEPFWTVRVQGDTVVLTGLDGKRAMALQSNETLFDGRNVIATDAKGYVEVRVTPRACQDSMSGEDFPYTARVTVDAGRPVLGCARDP